MRVPKVGDVISIEFDDHNQGDGEEDIFPATAYGKVIKVDANKIVLDAWHATADNHLRKSGSNELDTFVIVRRAINAIYRVTKWETL